MESKIHLSKNYFTNSDLYIRSIYCIDIYYLSKSITILPILKSSFDELKILNVNHSNKHQLYDFIGL